MRIDLQRRADFRDKLNDFKDAKARGKMEFEEYKRSVIQLAQTYWNDLGEGDKQLFEGFKAEDPN